MDEPPPKHPHRAELAADGDTFTLVAIRIHTGRTHQIRVHMQHIGHPTVCDARYTLDRVPMDAKYLPEHLRLQLLKEALRLDPELTEDDLQRGVTIAMRDLPEQLGRAIGREAFLRDLQWCPRNFLHRYRLAFRDLDDVPREAIAPMPDDLTTAMESLVPLDPWSASVCQQWMDPAWRCKAWREIDVMPREITGENARRETLRRYPDGRLPVEVEEKRMDPYDERFYTLEGLRRHYKGVYSDADIRSYWKYAMMPNEYKAVD